MGRPSTGRFLRGLRGQQCPRRLSKDVNWALSDSVGEPKYMVLSINLVAKRAELIGPKAQDTNTPHLVRAGDVAKTYLTREGARCNVEGRGFRVFSYRAQH